MKEWFNIIGGLLDWVSARSNLVSADYLVQ